MSLMMVRKILVKAAWIFSILLLLVGSALADSKTQNVELHMSIDGTIEIDPTGRVHDYAIETRLAPAIRGHIDQRVRQWQFEPVTVDGRGVAAKTRMQLELVAVPDGENFQLRVDAARFGGTRILDQREQDAIRYPKEALRNRIGARVTVALHLDLLGNVTDVHPYQVSLTRRVCQNVARKWRELFYRATASKVRQWKFEPAEFVDGKPVAGAIVLSVEFRLIEDGEQSPDSRWRAYVPGPVSAAHWMDDEPDQRRFDRLKDREALAVSSRFRLLDDVVGTLL